jgi:hypothetical protein
MGRAGGNSEIRATAGSEFQRRQPSYAFGGPLRTPSGDAPGFLYAAFCGTSAKRRVPWPVDFALVFGLWARPIIRFLKQFFLFLFLVFLFLISFSFVLLFHI